jgi:hypothetical protein
MENKNIDHDDALSKLPKDSGFEVPNGYFDSVEDAFSIKLRESSFPKDSGFEIPDDYFNSLENQILSKVELPKKGKIIPLKSRLVRITSIAAAFALLLMTYFTLQSEPSEPSSEEIALWITNNIGEIYTEDIINGFDEVANLDASFLNTPLENNTIENYLDENDTYILIKESQGLFDEIN